MFYSNQFLLTVFVFWTTAAALLSAESFRVLDGEILLEGEFAELSSVHVTSRDGLLSLGTAPRIVENWEPFSPELGTVVVNTPSNVVIGQLGGGIDVEGITPTSILYSESLEVAVGDVTVALGIDGLGTWNIETVDEIQSRLAGVGGGFKMPGVSIVDGAITLVGEFKELAGIEAVSLGGFFSFDSTTFEASTSLFAALRSTVDADEPTGISITALTADDRLQAQAETPTGILYSGDTSLAFDDLVVSVGLGDSPPVAISFVPEPSGLAIGLVGYIGALAIRSRRTRVFCGH